MKTGKNKWVTSLLCGAIFVFFLGVYTKIIWQSGFDAGADVSQCLIATFSKDGPAPKHADMADSGCQRAKAYESNPLWILRRRSGG